MLPWGSWDSCLLFWIDWLESRCPSSCPWIVWLVSNFPSGIVTSHSFLCCTTVSSCVSDDLLWVLQLSFSQGLFFFSKYCFWLVSNFPSGIVTSHSFLCCTTVSSCVSDDLLWVLQSSSSQGLFFFQILLLQGSLLQTRYAQLYALSLSGVYFLK